MWSEELSSLRRPIWMAMKFVAKPAAGVTKSLRTTRLPMSWLRLSCAICAVNERDDGKHRRHCIAELIDHSYGRLSWKSRRNNES
jgi:hypothetical protein